MKTIIKYILYSLTGIVLFSACDDLNDPEMFTPGNEFVAFTSTTAVVSEINSIINIPVKVTALKGAPAISVTFEFDTEGLEKPAIEGEDFVLLNASKTLSVSDGYGFDTIRIQTIDNDLFTGNKKVNIKLVSNSLDYDFGADNILTLTINDDDHPLGWMLGEYNVAVTETSNGDKNFKISIVPVEGETDIVKIYGFSGVSYGAPAEPPASADEFDYSLIGTVSEDFSTLSIKAGQEWDDWLLGPASFTVWTDDYGDAEEADALIGDISTDNGVVITFNQAFTFLLTEGDYTGYGLQWAYNSDDELNSTTAVLTRIE